MKIENENEMAAVKEAMKIVKMKENEEEEMQ